MRPTRRLTALAFLGTALTATAGMATDASVTELTAVEAWEADRTIVFDAADVDLADFQWIARPIVVFADTDANPAFQEQLDLLQARIDELVARDVVLITDTNPTERSEIRTALRPRGFMLTLIGKDGGVKLRKPFPWNVRELSRSIDKMPMRQREIRDSVSN